MSPSAKKLNLLTKRKKQKASLGAKESVDRVQKKVKTNGSGGEERARKRLVPDVVVKDNMEILEEGEVEDTKVSGEEQKV